MNLTPEAVRSRLDAITEHLRNRDGAPVYPIRARPAHEMKERRRHDGSTYRETVGDPYYRIDCEFCGVHIAVRGATSDEAEAAALAELLVRGTEITLALRIEAADRRARADGIERALCSLTETSSANASPR